MSQQWLSDDCILDDLAKLNSHSPLHHSNAPLLPIFNKPPPTVVKEDNDFEDLLGEASHDECKEPDFSEITNQIRMVDEEDRLNNLHSYKQLYNQDSRKQKKGALEVLELKKPDILNPLVPEYVPRILSNKSENVADNELAHNDKAIKVAVEVKEKKVENMVHSTEQNNNTRIVKKNRNFGMDVLANLRAKQLEECSKAITEAVKPNTPSTVLLRKPEDFEFQHDVLPEVPSSINSEMATAETSDSCSVQQKAKLNNDVMDWLTKKEKTKPLRPALCHDTPTFKKKYPSTVPVTDKPGPCLEEPPSQGSPDITYVRTSEAETIYKKYQERLKTNMAIKEDIWTRTEREMKAKDEEIRRKQAETVNN